ncbi:MAG: RNA recognition motif domain-containing protein [Bacteriovoracales bacterium]
MITKPKNRSTEKLTSIYVGNLAFSRTESDIKTLFSQYGLVHSVKIIVDPQDPKKKKGYAFVFMKNPEQAQKAVKALNLKQVDNRILKVSLAKPQKSKMPIIENDKKPAKKSKKIVAKTPVIKAKRKSGLDNLLTFLKSKK